MSVRLRSHSTIREPGKFVRGDVEIESQRVAAPVAEFRHQSREYSPLLKHHDGGLERPVWNNGIGFILDVLTPDKVDRPGGRRARCASARRKVIAVFDRTNLNTCFGHELHFYGQDIGLRCKQYSLFEGARRAISVQRQPFGNPRYFLNKAGLSFVWDVRRSHSYRCIDCSESRGPGIVFFDGDDHICCGTVALYVESYEAIWTLERRGVDPANGKHQK